MDRFRMAVFPKKSVARQGTSAPQFAWFHPGTYFVAIGTGLDEWNERQSNRESAVNAVPVSSFTPTNETVENDDIPVEPPKTMKPKISKKETNQATPKVPKQRKPKDNTSKSTKSKSTNAFTAKHERRDLNIVVNGTNMDLSAMPAAVCTCTGVPRLCYRWGSGGWQSSCCTHNMSEYPLPMSTTRPGSRMAGRKMSRGAYEKVLQKLGAEGYDYSQPVDNIGLDMVLRSLLSSSKDLIA